MNYKRFFLFLLFVSFFTQPRALFSGDNEWVYLGPQSASIRVMVIALDPHNPFNIYAGTFYDGLWKSTDKGVSWSQLEPSYSQRSIVFDPIEPSVVYVLAYYHFYKSTDFGETWADLFHPLANVIVHDPRMSNTLYAGLYTAGGNSPGGVAKSTDGGANWFSLGLSNYDISGITNDPNDPNTIYATAHEVGIFKTGDGGNNWDLISSTGISNVFIDPNSPSILYGYSPFSGGVFKSIDSGYTWYQTNDGLTNLWVGALVIDPESSTTLYVGTVGDGVFKSINGGQNWVPINEGLTNPFIHSLVIKTASPKVLLAGANTGIYELIIDSPKDQIERLIGDVSDLIKKGRLNSGQGNALIVKLDGALKKLNKGNLIGACNELNAFINQINAFIHSAKLTPAEGKALIDAAQIVIKELRG